MMKIKIAAIAVTIAAAVLIIPSSDSSANGNPNAGIGVCEDLDTGHLSGGSGDTFEYTAPDGKLVDYYCVKAGSINQEDGPITVLVDPDAKTVIIDYPNKDSISHFSVKLVNDPDVPEEPDTLIVYGDWVTGTYACGDKHVEETRTVSTTTFSLVDNVWVANVPSISIETKIRELTEEEVNSLECEHLPPTSPPKTLAETGMSADQSFWVFLLAAGLTVLGSFLLATLPIRGDRKKHNPKHKL